MAVPALEKVRRAKVLTQVVHRMATRNIGFRAAAKEIGAGYGTLRNAIVGDVHPGPRLIMKCETWLNLVQGR